VKYAGFGAANVAMPVGGHAPAAGIGDESKKQVDDQRQVANPQEPLVDIETARADARRGQRY
jgi:hypothetical protein